MVDNPYEPKPTSPHEAVPRMLLRRGNGYSLPPIGDGRSFDRRHFTRQGRIATLLVVLMLVIPVVWFVGWDQYWWGRS
jgi:hypothetical protein